ncbi:MAG: GNAT family N-acetyltransferase [Clostridia bacterium]|nr:GNAT family N-acetyltransferase [Clostridia bacterium]
MIQTERLLLRRPEPVDANDFFDIFTDASTCQSDGGYPPYTVRDEAFQRDFDCIVKDAPNRLFAVEKQSGRVIGVLHLMDTETEGEKEIGYVIHRNWRRRGYASEALEAVMALLRTEGIRRIRCTVYLFNTPSQRLLEKLGFACVGLVEKQNPQWNERVYEKQMK